MKNNSQKFIIVDENILNLEKLKSLDVLLGESNYYFFEIDSLNLKNKPKNADKILKIETTSGEYLHFPSEKHSAELKRIKASREFIDRLHKVKSMQVTSLALQQNFSGSKLLHRNWIFPDNFDFGKEAKSRYNEVIKRLQVIYPNYAKHEEDMILIAHTIIFDHNYPLVYRLNENNCFNMLFEINKSTMSIYNEWKYLITNDSHNLSGTDTINKIEDEFSGIKILNYNKLLKGNYKDYGI